VTATRAVTTNVPYRLTRLGVVMSADPQTDLEAEGVLNPASGRSADGRLWLLPRLVAAGNVSRIGIAEVLVRAGRPAGVRRDGVVLAPDAGWERSHDHAGVEDPRSTWIPSLGVHVMSYVAFGPLGPRPALAVSDDLRSWRRLGPVHFEYEPELDVDLNLFSNKDVVYFPDAIPGPDGALAYAMLHRPTWDLGAILGGSDIYLPAGLDDPRPGIWISYTPVDKVRDDLRALTHVRSHRLVALPEYDYEALKIGAGPPPLRVDEGWLLIHHGVSGTLAQGWDPQLQVRYSAGAMLLDPADPGTVVARTPSPLLEPLTSAERDGAVPNVVFPTAIEQIDGQRFVFYGMADSRIGVASLDQLPNEEAP
jgi:beta-1,2-mannobiose phosphorylase / 1,2-beta-oligomannan phosphorylase